jgi:hypothetical protein
MKFDELRSIAHNIADSVACGGFLIGRYDLDIFGEARRSAEGFMTIDFLTGTCRSGAPSPSLAQAIALYKDALADLCTRHGTSISAFRELSARFSSVAYGARFPENARFIVTVEDQQGRRSTDEYMGLPGRRPKVLDHLGRIRRK